jgi:hypothetical protein
MARMNRRVPQARTRRAGVLLVLVSAMACHRDPPAGSGEPEHPLVVPTSSVPAPSHAAATSHILTPCPNGTVIVANAAACTVSLVGRDGPRWTRMLPSCNHVMEVAVAADSMVYARTERLLVAFANDGTEAWKMALGEVVPSALVLPATTRNSLVVVAVSPSSITAYTAAGTQAWNMRLPSDEAMTEAPIASLTEGLVLVTSSATYFVGGDGTMRSRHPHAAVR